MTDIRPADGAEIAKTLRDAARERILVLDGAMGTEIQALKLTEVINIDVTKVLKPHWAAGTDHFNIHASEWIHGIVVNEVLWACPPSQYGDVASKTTVDADA